ncbi:MAG TPA: FkbM family methyltransferase, partial [Geminicoccaceae bacterium]|nr:FkbM family methyltransferase [Geminicoccaceae bacterium]
KQALKRFYPPKVRHLKRRLEVRYLGKGEPELGLLPALLDRDRIAIDVGANIGDYLDVLARHARRVLAFEPHPLCFRHLQRVEPRRCQLFNLALSDRPGMAELRVPVEDAEISALATIEAGNPSLPTTCGRVVTYPVRTERLDDVSVCHLAPGEGVGFIKIDVEGHELAVLEGGAATIAAHRPLVMVETEYRHGAPVERIFSFFRERAYLARALVNGRLVEIDPPSLARLQDESKLVGEDNDRRESSYINNVLFFPEEQTALAARHG